MATCEDCEQWYIVAADDNTPLKHRETAQSIELVGKCPDCRAKAG